MCASTQARRHRSVDSMDTEALSYCRGTWQDPHHGRIALQIFNDERFVASHRRREIVNVWGGRLALGTFVKAHEMLSAAGFPEVSPIHERVPGEHPFELGWLCDRRWQRAETFERQRFTGFIILASTVLSVLDSDLAHMPPGEMTPVIEQGRFDPTTVR